MHCEIYICFNRIKKMHCPLELTASIDLEWSIRQKNIQRENVSAIS